MKALAIIFTCLFFVSLIGFAITIAATGVEIGEMVRSGNFNVGFYHTEFKGHAGLQILDTAFEETFSYIDISILASRANITLSDDGVTRVSYSSGNPTVTLDAGISGDSLIIRERRSGFFFFTVGIGTSRLDIELPEQLYNRISIDATSGTVTAELPDTDDLNINITSGRVTADFPDATKGGNLRSRATTGTININGFMPDTYDIHLTSGRQNITGLSGSGSVRLSSGRADVDFAEWDGSLRVSITSGSVNITVPAGSGADLSFSRTSGTLRYNLGEHSGSLNSSGAWNFGGDNRQRVDVNMTSGSASIADK